MLDDAAHPLTLDAVDPRRAELGDMPRVFAEKLKRAAGKGLRNRFRLGASSACVPVRSASSPMAPPTRLTSWRSQLAPSASPQG